jgi:hypothetical protein
MVPNFSSAAPVDLFEFSKTAFEKLDSYKKTSILKIKFFI